MIVADAVKSERFLTEMSMGYIISPTFNEGLHVGRDVGIEVHPLSGGGMFETEGFGV